MNGLIANISLGRNFQIFPKVAKPQNLILTFNTIKVLSSPRPGTFLIFKIEITESYLASTLLTVGGNK